MTTAKNLDINVHHVTRVEGHGNIVVNVKNGKLEKCELNIVEAPRFFEAFLRGRSWKEAALITSRICGICSPGHQLASLKATEDAMGIKVSEQTVLLRKLECDGAFLQSHVLHVYFLVAPDLVGAPSVIPLASSYPDVVKRALRLKKLANDICDVVGGRAVHPITMVPGGFTKIPKAEDLKALRGRIVAAIPDYTATVELIAALAGKLPSFTRETEYISLGGVDGEFPLYDGKICSSDTGLTSDKTYRKMTNERVVPHSSSKHTAASRESYMVGALARCHNNFDKLNATGKSAAKALGYKPPMFNPYLNNVCQVVEAGHVAQEMIELIDKLVAMGPKDEKVAEIRPKAGTGIGATEVPRGILYHEYTYDDTGMVVDANCIIPTGQNLANIDHDMRKLVPEMIDAGKSKDEITFALEMLVRAYDPCISCSVHLLDVQFVE